MRGLATQILQGVGSRFVKRQVFTWLIVEESAKPKQSYSTLLFGISSLHVAGTGEMADRGTVPIKSVMQS
jgi:hypothetical protein